MSLRFEWHPEKAANNLRKHKVSFEEAATVFDDPLGATVADPDHSTEEDRYVIVGRSNRRRLLIVAYAEREHNIRVISARALTNHERQQYEANSQ